jgi:morphogenetic protein associated with SpoVID
LKIHIVKKNDTLFNLANKYHVDLDGIIALNPQIQDPNKIEVGMKVKIPSQPQPVEPPSSDYAHKHIVKQGDSLWKLGKAWQIPLQTIIKANPQLKNPNVLMTGEVVYIPKLDSIQSMQAPMTPEAEMPGGMPQFQSPTMPQEQTPNASPQQDSSMMPQEQTPNAMPQYQSPMMTQQQMPNAMPQYESYMMPQDQMPHAMPQYQSPMAPQQQMPNSMFQYDGPTGDISSHAAAKPGSDQSMPAENMMADVPMLTTGESSWSMPFGAHQNQIMAETDTPNLNIPYQQTQNPFDQVHIKATEVFAYSEPLEYGNETLASNIPEMPPMYGDYQPFTANSPAYQAQPAYQTQPAYQAQPSYQANPAYPAKNCGCGGSAGGESYAQPWNAYPSYSQFSPMEMPYSPYQMQPATGMFPYSMMSVPYPMTGGEIYPGYAYGAENAGLGYAYPSSSEPSPHVPEAHIHQWNENAEKEAQEDRDASAVKNITKTTGKTKKTKHAGSSEFSQAGLRRQQPREERAEPKANLPWINV